MRKNFLDLTKEELLAKVDWYKDKNMEVPVQILNRIKELDPSYTNFENPFS